VVAAPVLPLNAALLTVPAFSDPRVEFGTERCYIVRRVEMTGPVAIESAPSSPVCVTPVDKFAPAAPRTVNLVATASAVSLIWEPNTEADLAGYLVLRGEAPGDKLAPLTPAPIGDAAYVDNSIRRNRTYVYEVIAIDKAGNQSAPSNRVEESIR
jgi:fibronectin type 3 domain-containing protein